MSKIFSHGTDDIRTSRPVDVITKISLSLPVWRSHAVVLKPTAKFTELPTVCYLIFSMCSNVDL